MGAGKAATEIHVVLAAARGAGCAGGLQVPVLVLTTQTLAPGDLRYQVQCTPHTARTLRTAPCSCAHGSGGGSLSCLRSCLLPIRVGLCGLDH